MTDSVHLVRWPDVDDPAAPPHTRAGLARPLLLLLLLLCAATALAQEQPSPYDPLRPIPVGTTLLTLPSPHVTPTHSWEVVFMHRFTEATSGGSHSLWGLDGGANVTFGLAYVPMRDLQLSAIRSNVLDDVELSAKYAVMQQAPAIPLSLSIRGGSDIRTEKNVADRTSFFAQAIVARQFAERFEIYAVPTYVTKAGRANAGDQSVALFDQAFNVPVAISYEVLQNLSVVAEVVPVNRDLPDAIDSDFGWAVGIKKVIGGHHFEVLLTNSTSTTVGQYATTSNLGAPLSRGDVHIGFNIERQFGGE